MKTLRTLLSLVFLGAMQLGIAQEKYEIVDGAGYLVLKGKSNTTNWELRSNQLKGDALLLMDENQLEHLSRVIVNIDANTIQNADNKRMTRKAQRTLLTEENPIVTFFAYGYSQVNDGPMIIPGNIYLAGKNADLQFTFKAKTEEEIVWIVAEANAKFSDFGLDPPTDFG
ncbi:MAG TPA: YceI family protein, partial [Roseivirga sp.]